MEAFKLKIYKLAMGKSFSDMRPGSAEKLDFSLFELFYYIWQKGGFNLIRGSLQRWRLKKSKGRFFLGKNVKLLFPSYLEVGSNVAIGDYSYLNCLSKEGVYLADNVRLKEYTWLQTTSILTQVGVGCRIGCNTYIGPHCTLGAGGGLTIDENVTIGAYVDLLAEDHKFEDSAIPVGEQGIRRQGIVIERNCWLGNKVIVLDGVTVGEGSVIGAGAVVTKSVPAYSLAVGNPARVIRSLR